MGDADDADGRELVRLPVLAWLSDLRWPVDSAIFDGEIVAGDGSEGIQAVFEARNALGSPMAFAAFDLLHVDGQNVMREPWSARRKRLEDLFEAPPSGVCLVPVTDDAPTLWDTRTRIDGQISALRRALEAMSSNGARTPGLKASTRRRMSAVARKAVSARMKAYWLDSRTSLAMSFVADLDAFYLDTPRLRPRRRVPAVTVRRI